MGLDAEPVLPPAMIDDIIAGNVRNSIGNIARVAGLAAGMPDSVPALTVDRQCASSLEALSIAAGRVDSGGFDAILVGGVESASRCPWLLEKTPRAFSYAEPRPYEVLLAPESTGNASMGETAEILADEFNLTREQLDAFACQSHGKAAEASRTGAFSDEICPLDAIERDECIRPDTTAEGLAKLRPVFRKNGSVTAGNSSPLNDGASSALVLSARKVKELHVKPDAFVRGIQTVGLDPNRMGLGPALTIPKLLHECGLGCDDIDLFEINEAFAAQMLATLEHLKTRSNITIPPGKLNVHGGAIALGHPLGATGLRLVVTLVHALRRRGKKRGIAALCAGGGQGMGVLVELPD
jgi:acetyl-CoA C-acetyltransferase